VECKQASILLPASVERGLQDSGGGICGGMIGNNATLLVRNFLALRLPRNGGDKTNNSNNNNTCCRQHQQHSDVDIVCCGSDHFDSLLQYHKERPLDAQEKLDFQRAAQALWNQRKAINKTKQLSFDIINSRAELEEQLECDLRRFRVNNFGVTDSMQRVVASGVYPLGALLNHSCAPNCLLRYDFTSTSCEGCRRQAPLMEIVASRDIQIGEELTHSYVELVSPMHARRTNLREIYGFDCHCAMCSSFCEEHEHEHSSSATTDAAARFRITLPKNYQSFSSIELTQWVLHNYNPAIPRADPCLVFVDQDLILRRPTFKNNSNSMEMIVAGKAKQQEAQNCMMNGDIDGELACLNEAVQIFESLLTSTSMTTSICTPPLSLDLYKARCDRLGTLIVAGGEVYSEEALKECEHIVSFLCLALKHVPNHSLLGLQLFTLGDLYEANGKRDRAQSTYVWARRILRISQGANGEMVMILNEKII